MNIEYIGYVLMLAAIIYILTKGEKGKPTNPVVTPTTPPTEPPATPPTDNVNGSKKIVRTIKNPNTRFMTVMSSGWTGTYNRSGKGCVVHHNEGMTILHDVNESVYDLYKDPHTGQNYASCEESEGRVFDPKTGAVIFRGGAQSTIACRRIFGKIVTISANWNNKDYRVQINGGRGMSLPTGGRRFFLRDLIQYNSKAFIFGFDYDAEMGGFWRSTDLKNWTWYPLFKHQRPMKVALYDGGIAYTFSTYVRGKRVTPAGVGIWKNGKAVDLHTTYTGAIGMGILVRRGKLFYSTLDNWKGSGSSHIFTNQSGKWEMLATFPEAECWDLAISPTGKILAATGQEGGNAVLYSVGNGETIDVPDPDPDPSDNDDPDIVNLKVDGEFIWKPISDGVGYGGNLAIVLPKGWSARKLTVNGESAYDGRHVEELSGRQVWRTHQKGATYGKWVKIVIDDVIKREVPDGAKRYGRVA